MHYFVTLFPVPDGADPWATWEVIDERMDKAYSGDGPPPPTEAERAEMLEMAKTLRSWRPTLAEDGAMGSSFDLQDRELEVDLNIYADRTINVALPYVQDRGRDMMEFVMGCLEKLNKNDVY